MQLPDSANKVELNRSIYHLNVLTGRLMNVTTHSETGSEQTADRSRGVLFTGRIGSRTMPSTTLLMRDDKKNEHVVKLTNFDVSCLVGQVVSVLTAARMGQREPTNVGLYTHDTNVFAFNHPAIKLLAAPSINRWVVSIMLALAIVFGVLGDGMAAFIMVVAMVPALFVSMGIKNLVGRTRVRRFRHGPEITRIRGILEDLDKTPYLQLREQKE